MDIKLRKRAGRKVEYLDTDGKWKTTGQSTKIEAVTWLNANRGMSGATTLAEFADGFYTDEGIGTFKYLCEQTGTHKHEEWWKSNNSRYLIYIRPKLGKMPLSRITTPIVQDWYLSLEGVYKKSISPATRKKILNALSTIMDHAIFRGLMDKNPCKNVIRIKEANKGRNPYSEEEIDRMFPDNPQMLVDIWGGLKWACFFLIMRDTGWRPGEVAGLSPDGFFPEQKAIYTKQSVDSFSKNIQQSIKTTGRGKDYKIGFLTQETNAYLKLYLATEKPKELIFRTDRNGTVLTTGAVYRQFGRAMEKIGIDWTGRPPYALRTTFMTNMAKSEVSQEKIMELMGHTKWQSCYDQRTPLEVIEKVRRLQ